jgi:exosortase
MRIPPKLAIALVCLGAAFAFAYFDVFVWLFDDWELDGNYSHGWLIVPMAAYMAWERRHQLARAERTPSAWGLVLLVVSIGTLAAGTLAAETTVARLSIILTIVSAIWFIAGLEYLRILTFPIAFLLLMIPIPGIIFNRITFPLQLVASDFGARALDLVGIPVFREGNLINLAHLSLDVAEACSGIRSLISLFTLSLLYGYFAEPHRTIRIILLIATVPVAIIANGTRVAATGMAAHWYGAQAAEGFFHSFSGWIVFAVAAAALVLVRAGAMKVLKPWLGPITQAAPAGEFV